MIVTKYELVVVAVVEDMSDTDHCGREQKKYKRPLLESPTMLVIVPPRHSRHLVFSRLQLAYYVRCSEEVVAGSTVFVLLRPSAYLMISSFHWVRHMHRPMKTSLLGEIEETSGD